MKKVKRTLDSKLWKTGHSLVITIPLPIVERFKLKEKDIIEVVLKLEDKKK